MSRREGGSVTILVVLYFMGPPFGLTRFVLFKAGTLNVAVKIPVGERERQSWWRGCYFDYLLDA